MCHIGKKKKKRNDNTESRLSGNSDSMHQVIQQAVLSAEQGNK